MATYVSYITAVDEEAYPPQQQLLEVSASGDQVYLGIVRLDEHFAESTFTKVHQDAGIMVSRQELLDILLADLPEPAGHVKITVGAGEDVDMAKEALARLGRLLRDKLSPS